MKKLLTLALVCLAYATSFGQNVPQGIAYQAVAVKDGAYSVAGQNPQAIYWSNKEIKVRFTIFDKYPNGSSQYSEVHTTSTDEYGVFNLIIGQGSGLSGDFTTIPWELGDAHLQVEIDFENTNTFTLTALEKFWSVPYAFISNETDASSIDSAIQALNDKITYLKDRDQDTVVGNELQTLSVTGDSVTISDGNTVVINHPANLDNDSTNEIQSLTIKGDSLSISDGNAVKINHPANLDNDSTNEIQTLAFANDTLFLSGPLTIDTVSLVNLSSGNTIGGAGFNFSMPDGLVNVQKIKHTLLSLCSSNSSTCQALVVPYQVPNGKNLYITSLSFAYRYYCGGPGIKVNGVTLLTGGCSASSAGPFIIGEGTSVSMYVGSGAGCGYGCAGAWGGFSGFLVDKSVEVILQNSAYTVPNGYYFIVSGNSPIPQFYTSGEVVPAATNGYILPY
ncbi:hypothetical protein OAD66_09910 [Bacteroidia bacterium]|nr:hypothetical protein [Bacteroidia bacterium]